MPTPLPTVVVRLLKVLNANVDRLNSRRKGKVPIPPVTMGWKPDKTHDPMQLLGVEFILAAEEEFLVGIPDDIASKDLRAIAGWLAKNAPQQKKSTMKEDTTTMTDASAAAPAEATPAPVAAPAAPAPTPETMTVAEAVQFLVEAVTVSDFGFSRKQLSDMLANPALAIEHEDAIVSAAGEALLETLQEAGEAHVAAIVTEVASDGSHSKIAGRTASKAKAQSHKSKDGSRKAKFAAAATDLEKKAMKLAKGKKVAA